MPMESRGLRRPISRRTLLTAAALAPVLSACTTNPISTGPTLTTGVLHSTATGQDHEWAIWYPSGADQSSNLPVVIVLHGLGDTIDAVQELGYTTQATTVIKAGAAPFALAAVNGSDLFWQKVGSQDAGAMVAKEFVGVLNDNGLDTSRMALTGWSMGGWGTLRLAEDELHGKLRAVAAISTPCYPDYKFVPGPYQEVLSRKLFETGNFYTHPNRLTDLPIFLACGTDDPFEVGNENFVIILDSEPGVLQPTREFGPGGHDADYWRSVAAAQFAFLSEHLA